MIYKKNIYLKVFYYLKNIKYIIKYDYNAI